MVFRFGTNPTGIRAISFRDLISTSRNVIRDGVGHVGSLAIRGKGHPGRALSAQFGASPVSFKSGSEYAVKACC